MTRDAEYRARLTELVECEAIALDRCRKSGLVEGYRWAAKGRTPPLPFHSFVHDKAKCRVCGQPTKGRLTWHHQCVTAYLMWTKPADYAGTISFRQGGLCAITRIPIGPPARTYISQVEIDHETPIYRVRREMADRPWFELLPFWGLANLRAITVEAHKTKSATEARERAAHRTGTEFPLLDR
jgi:hypothetical protein